MAGICFNCFRNIPDSGACPYCGYNHEQDIGKYPLALHPGSMIGNRYYIGRVLGQGGYGITYVAYDNQLRTRVAMKEYMPVALAIREQNTQSLQMYSGDKNSDFQFGEKQFLDEAKTLAEFSGHEQIVRIYNYFEGNGTAYFTMEYVDGVNLKQYMRHYGGPLPVHVANQILLPVMESLDWVHSKGIIHRDISPDNIMIKRDGTIRIIDFGAARYSTSEKSRSLDVVLKHGFAPVEQYSRRGKQGPYTDVYAMAATYYFAITGKVLSDSIDRREADDLQLPSALGVKIRKETEKVLEKALSVLPQDRYQTMAEFYQAMMATMPLPFASDAGEHEEIVIKKSEEDHATGKKRPGKGRLIAVLGAAVMVIAAVVLFPRITRTDHVARESVSPTQEISISPAETEAGTDGAETGEEPITEAKSKTSTSSTTPETEAGTPDAATAEEQSPEESAPEATEQPEEPEQLEPPMQEEAIPEEEISGETAADEAAGAGLTAEEQSPEESAPEEAVQPEQLEESEVTEQPEASEPPMQEEAEAEAEEEEENLPAVRDETDPGTGTNDFTGVGNIVVYGSYEQDGDPDNGKEPLEWIVLAVEENRSLLISRYAIDTLEYNSNHSTFIRWEQSSLRKWLNDSFRTEAFSDEEEELIQQTTQKNGQDRNSGNDTRDKVFLLSRDEALEYLGTADAKSCIPTEYAREKKLPFDEESGFCDWWLRSPGGSAANQVYYMTAGGEMLTDICSNKLGIRPAIWVEY